MSMSPTDLGPDKSIDAKDVNKDDIYDLLGEDKEDEVIDLKGEKDDKSEKPDKTDKVEKKSKADKPDEKKDDKDADEDKDKGDEDEEVDELDEIEKELADVTDDELELTTPVRRSEILKKFPTLFKEFPYLEKMYYREQKFTEMFGTVDDAEAIVEKAGTLDKFEADLMKGNTTRVLQTVKSENPRAFAKMVDEYVNTLYTVDPQAYYTVISNVVKQGIGKLMEAGKKKNDGDMQAAAEIMHEFMFGEKEIDATPVRLSGKLGKEEEDEPEDKFTKREEMFLQRQLDNNKSEVNTRITNRLKATIEHHIDPKGSMTEYVKRNATKDALDNLDKIMKGDKRLSQILDKLWERVITSDFSKDTISSVESTYLSKAKTLLVPVIKKARNEALRGLGRRVKDDEDETDNKGHLPVGRTASKQGSNKKPVTDKEKAKAIPAGMSNRDFIMSDD